MTVALFVVAAMAGGLLRWAATSWWYCTWQALLVVNVAGSALLGWLVAADASTATITIVGLGFAGSLTTFSSFAREVLRHRPGFAAGYAASTVVSCIAAAAAAASL